MGTLLRYEFRRILKSRYFYICSAISFVMIFLAALGTKVLQSVAQQVAMEGVDPSSITSSGLIGLKTGMSGGLFTVLGAIIIGMFISEEYSQETIKNVYSKGYSRNVVFFSTYIVSLVAAIVLFLLESLINFGFHTLFFQNVGTPGENYALSMVGLLLIAIAYHAFFFGLSISVRKSGPAIALAIAAPLILAALVALLDTLLFRESSFKLADYWLSGRESAMAVTNVSIEEFGKTIASSLVLTALLLGGSFLINSKRES